LKIIREFSSGGIVFKKEEDEVLWLVAKTATSKFYPKPIWRLPKGWIDDAGRGIPGPMASGKIKADEESLQTNALREVREEGGVEAKILKKIGSIKYFYTFPGRGRILKFVTFYLMEWRRDLPEGFDYETSEVAWLPYDEARKILYSGGEKQMLKKAKDLLTEAHLV